MFPEYLTRFVHDVFLPRDPKKFPDRGSNDFRRERCPKYKKSILKKTLQKVTYLSCRSVATHVLPGVQKGPPSEDFLPSKSEVTLHGRPGRDVRSTGFAPSSELGWVDPVVVFQVPRGVLS